MTDKTGELMEDLEFEKALWENSAKLYREEAEALRERVAELQAAINWLADPAESFCEGDFPDYTDALRNEIDQRIEYAQQFATEVE